jgi:hypothetical protein
MSSSRLQAHHDSGRQRLLRLVYDGARSAFISTLRKKHIIGMLAMTLFHAWTISLDEKRAHIVGAFLSWLLYK